MEKILLRFMYFFRGALRRQGVDVERMFTIVQMKLTMDKRRVNMSWRRGQQKEESSNPMGFVLLMYAIFGIFIAAVLWQVPSFILVMIILHSYLLFMMSMTLVTDFSTVLLDTTDNQVILPRPVNSKTLFMARTVHIFIYLLQFTIALSICPVVAVFIKYGWLIGLANIAAVLLTVLLAVFLTYLLYLLIMQLSSEEKVKEVVTFFQIFMTIFFVVGFQVMPRLINWEQLSFNFQLHWYSYLVPPVWMATALDTLYSGIVDVAHITMIVLAVGVPIVTFRALIKYLAPSFAAKLASVNQDGGAKTSVHIVQQNRKLSLSEKLSKWICSTDTERASFMMTWKITGRDKSFRMQFYPSLAYIPVFIFIIVFNSGRQFSEHWQQLPEGNKFLWLIYLPMFTISGSIILVSFNENFQAAWVYYCTPVGRPGELVTGMLKALFIKYFPVVYATLLAFALYIWGPAIIDDFIFGLFNNLLCFLIFATLSEHYLPFSRQPNIKQQSGRFVMVIIQMVLVGVLVGIHYVAIKYWWWLGYALMVPAGIGCYLMLRSLKRLPWSRIAV